MIASAESSAITDTTTLSSLYSPPEILETVPLLVGMGLDEFSMSATSVLRTRSLMKKLDTAKMQEYANRALTECSTMEEVLELSKEYVNVD